jgi:hypothetical protein
MRASIRRLLLNPLASLVLLGVLAADAALLPADTTEWMGPGTWRWVRHWNTAGFGMHDNGGPIAWFAIREGSELRLTHPNEVSWDEVTRLLSERPGDVLGIACAGARRRTGLWAPTREHETVRIELRYGSGFTPRERERARALFIDTVIAPAWRAPADGDDPQSPERLDHLRRGDVEATRVLWGGHVHNAASLLALLAALYSLQWVPRAPAWLRARRHARALARARCPQCGYSITGLPGNRCPECGRTW